MRDAFYQILIAFSLVGCSCATSMRLDPQSAVAGNDLTALVSGCGKQISSGVIICRIPEGQPTGKEFLAIHHPPSIKCNVENVCTFFKIFYPDGRPTYEGSIPKGQGSSKVSFFEITDKKVFEPEDIGEYGISVTTHYFGPDGQPRKMYATGYLRLIIIKRNYTPLAESEDDENFFWKWTDKTTKQTIKVTTGYRVYISPPPGEKL